MKKLLLIPLLFFGAERLCHRATDGFTVAKITTELSYDPKWDTVPPEKELLSTVLGQPFTYLTKGGQSYVFASEDGYFVLKFFRYPHRLPFVHTHVDRSRDFLSAKIAYTDLKDETGLIYVHLNPTKTLKTVTLVDKLGISHPIHLDDYAFVLQRRASPVFISIAKWMEKGEVDKAKEGLSSLIELIAERAAKGIVDHDPNLSKNFGFLGTRAIEIDIGRFAREKGSSSLLHKSSDLRYWLSRHYPDLSHYFEEELKTLEL